MRTGIHYSPLINHIKPVSKLQLTKHWLREDGKIFGEIPMANQYNEKWDYDLRLDYQATL